jgi:hypothetical protein
MLSRKDQKTMMHQPDTDFHAWAMEAAERVRTRQLIEEDYKWIAMNLEFLGLNEQWKLETYLYQKYQYQPSHNQAPVWRQTLCTQRRNLARLIKYSPSLKPYFEAVRKTIYEEARDDEASETGLPLTHFPETFAHTGWTWEQALDLDFYPGENS